MTSQRRRQIVAGFDGSLNSLAAVDFAVREAVLRQLPLHVLAAHPTTAPGASGPPPGVPGTPCALHGTACLRGASLTALLRRVCASWPELTASACNRTGDPAELLIDASRSAALMVVGRGRPARPQPVGRVAAQVAAHSRCPTVVVPPGGAVEPAGVMVGLGMAPEDEAVLGFAFDTAALRRVPLLAVHVWTGIPTSAVGALSPFRYDLRYARQAADDQLAELLAPWAEKYPEVRVERMPLYDADPAHALADASGLAGLVVVGSHRHHLRSSHLLGTTTHTLLQRVRCPVVVIGA